MKNVEIKVKSEYAVEFEAFCCRNNIPCVLHSRGEDCTYLVRPGADHRDALIMVLKRGWTGEAETDINLINLLVMSHNCLDIQYEYELSLPSRQDEEILSIFVSPALHVRD